MEERADAVARVGCRGHDPVDFGAVGKHRLRPGGIHHHLRDKPAGEAVGTAGEDLPECFETVKRLAVRKGARGIDRLGQSETRLAAIEEQFGGGRALAAGTIPLPPAPDRVE